MAPHSNTLAWKIPWMKEPGGLKSMGSRGVWYDWVTSLSLFTFMHWRRKRQPTLVFLPGESQGRGAWWAAVYGVAQSRTRLKRLSSSSREREKAKTLPKGGGGKQRSCWFTNPEISWVKSETYPHTERVRSAWRSKDRGIHSKLVGGRFNK